MRGGSDYSGDPTLPNCTIIPSSPLLFSSFSRHISNVMLLECKFLKSSSFIPLKCLEGCPAYCIHSINIYCWMVDACPKHCVFKQKKPWKHEHKVPFVLPVLPHTLHSALPAAPAAHIQPSCVQLYLPGKSAHAKTCLPDPLVYMI